MTPDERQSWMRAIIEAPADDLPRLVFADRLDEMGDPRGEFIRVQIDRAILAPLPSRQCVYCLEEPDGYCGDGCPYCLLGCRERELLLKHGRGWAAEMVHAAKGGDGQFMKWDHEQAEYHSTRRMKWQFTRGFVSHLTASWADWSRHATDIRAATPLEELTLTNTLGSHAETVALSCRGLRRVTIQGGGSDFRRWVGVVRSYLPDTEVIEIPSLVSNGTREALETDMILYGSAFIDPQTGQRIPPDQVRYTESRGIINARTGHGSAETFRPPPSVRRRGSPFSRQS